MTVFVLGGSNSMFRDGWVAYFASRTKEDVVDLSVGATTTLSGIYRFMLDDRPVPGDTVLWEYALNEVNHVGRGQSIDVLLKNVEHLVAICRQRNLRFLPVIFTPRPQEQAPERSAYYDRLLALFAHYGLPAIDISTAWRVEHNQPRMPIDLHADPSHYRRSPELMDWIADRVAAMQPQLPNSADPLFTGGVHLRLVTDFAQDRFQNSIMDIPAARIPISIISEEESRAIALFVICNPRPRETGIRLRLRTASGPDLSLRVSTSSKGAFGKQVLKAISIEQGSRHPWIFSPGSSLEIKPIIRPGKAYAEAQVRAKLTHPEPVTTPCITGVLLEVGAIPSISPAQKMHKPVHLQPVLSTPKRALKRLQRWIKSRI